MACPPGKDSSRPHLAALLQLLLQLVQLHGQLMDSCLTLLPGGQRQGEPLWQVTLTARPRRPIQPAV